VKKEKYFYPVQFANIEKDEWRLGKSVCYGKSNAMLILKENALWRQIEKIANEATPPPETHEAFSESRLIGHGWEWAVYQLQNENNVIKVPAGIFWEVNDVKYLENTEKAYNVCKKYLGELVVETSFERSNGVNLLRQRKIEGEEIDFINISRISNSLRKNLITTSEAMLKILGEYDWMPDIHLRREKKNREKGWHVHNLLLEGDNPMFFDFTAYYDVFRLYPQRMKEEIIGKGGLWKEFLSELLYTKE